MKTIQRDVLMEERIVMRCTPEDKVQLQRAARLNGTNVATLLRQALIKQGHLKP